MTKNYLELQFFGNTIEDAVNELLTYKEKGKLASGDFNGTLLYSDTVTMDSAYTAITGYTKAEFDEAMENRKTERQRKQKEHEERIPELIKVWSAKGREVLAEDKWAYWNDIVPVRLNDLYQGMELEASLDIIRILNDGGTLEEAKEKIESQNHSGTSFGLVRLMVKEFAERGEEFSSYVN